jgi:mannosyltransferase OCH1-like enzyme
MNLYLFFLIILLILILLTSKKNVNESYVNYKNPYNTNKIYNIWMYWENLPGRSKSPYLDLCYKTVLKNCKNFKIHLLNDKAVYKYLPNLNKNLDSILTIQQKVDYIRYLLLYKYGGIWVDADTIVITNLSPIIDKLKYYDFVGFGCHFNNEGKCEKTGKPYPANWVMGSRKNGKLMKYCVDKCNMHINNNQSLKRKYHILGREIVWKGIKELNNNDKEWNYYHYNSKCIDRDSKNKKITNKKILSNDDIDNYCKDKMLFIPIYNSAPGFPSWFKTMSEKEILKGNFLISKLLNKSLD